MVSWSHRRRKRGGGGEGARGRLAPPPSFKLGGHRPPNFTHCLHNELHCSIVDRIACRHCSSRKSHFCCLKKMSPPQVRTSSYAYAWSSLAAHGNWPIFALQTLPLLSVDLNSTITQLPHRGSHTTFHGISMPFEAVNSMEASKKKISVSKALLPLIQNGC